jgi:hypothetical protein
MRYEDTHRKIFFEDRPRMQGIINALRLQIKEMEQVTETPDVLDALSHLHQAVLALEAALPGG